MSSPIIWKEVTESDELTRLVSNSWHTQSAMWLMALFCSEAENKAEVWESRRSASKWLLKNDILTEDLQAYTVGSTLVHLFSGFK